MLRLAAFDDEDGGGLHYQTALTICGIVAGNNWNGWFTASKEGDKVSMELDGILKGTMFFYHLPSPESVISVPVPTYYEYPISPCFRSWPFPHSSPPPGWPAYTGQDIPASQMNYTASDISQFVRARDGSCRAELTWFKQQYMSRYNLNSRLNDNDSANTLALRRDIHAAFDSSDASFVLVPKSGKWVAHFLQTSSDLGPEHHNQVIEVPAAVGPAFLLARLAWAILPLLQTFLLSGQRRLLIVACETENGEIEHTEQQLGCAQIEQLITPKLTRTRSNSPKKRNRGDNSSDDLSLPQMKRSRAQSSSTLSVSLETAPLPPARVKGLLLVLSLGRLSKRPGIDVDEADKADEAERRRLSQICDVALRAQRAAVKPELICCDYAAWDKERTLYTSGETDIIYRDLCLSCMGYD